MSGTLKRAVFAMLGAMVMLLASAASAGAGPSRGSDLAVRNREREPEGDPRSGTRGPGLEQGHGGPDCQGQWLLQHLRRSGFHAADEDAGSPAGGSEGFGPEPASRAPAAHRRGARADHELRGQDPAGEGRRCEGPGETRARHEAMQAEAGRSQPCRSLRLHRRTRRIAVSPSVPRRLLHNRRSLDPNRSPDRSQDRRDAAERHRHADRRRALPPQRRLQPRAGDPAPRAGAR